MKYFSLHFASLHVLRMHVCRIDTFPSNRFRACYDPKDPESADHLLFYLFNAQYRRLVDDSSLRISKQKRVQEADIAKGIWKERPCSHFKTPNEWTPRSLEIKQQQNSVTIRTSVSSGVYRVRWLTKRMLCNGMFFY